MREVLRQYAVEEVTQVEDLAGAGGFSGAQFWRFQAGSRQLCLRQWPVSHPSEDRLSLIHGVLIHAAQHGFDRLPVPLRTRFDTTFVSHQGSLWELSDWLPGDPDDDQPPQQSRVEAAMRALAQFHLSVEDYPVQSKLACPPGIRQRAGLLQELKTGRLDRSISATQQLGWSGLRQRASNYGAMFPVLANRLQSRLDQAVREKVALRPCIRDIRREHVLFLHNEVRGLVDFGALRHDCATGDVARLLGGFARDDEALWAAGLAAYQAERELSPADIERVLVFDQSNVVMSVANWLQWISLENRRFAEPQVVLDVIDSWLNRMEHAVASR